MKAVLLLGPTASGKTAVALALAARFPLKIVSVDSAQVYRGMDIGTAKPDAATRASVPHHLVDIVDPTDPYSAGRFRSDAMRAMEAIAARGKVPLLAGGTMLYFRALTSGLAELPPAEPAIRRDIEERARREGWPVLHRELAIVDAATAARVKPTDAQRIQRALEVHRTTGRALSTLHAQSSAAELGFEAVATIWMSLSPRPDSVSRLIPGCGLARIHARACAGSSAGIMPSVRVKRKNASRASVSPTET